VSRGPDYVGPVEMLQVVQAEERAQKTINALYALLFISIGINLGLAAERTTGAWPTIDPFVRERLQRAFGTHGSGSSITRAALSSSTTGENHGTSSPRSLTTGASTQRTSTPQQDR